MRNDKERIYLEENVITQPDAIEKLICEPFHKLPRHPMSREVSEMMIRLMLTCKAMRSAFFKLRNNFK